MFDKGKNDKNNSHKRRAKIIAFSCDILAQYSLEEQHYFSHSYSVKSNWINSSFMLIYLLNIQNNVRVLTSSKDWYFVGISSDGYWLSVQRTKEYIKQNIVDKISIKSSKISNIVAVHNWSSFLRWWSSCCNSTILLLTVPSRSPPWIHCCSRIFILAL
jgi:hypothetical protein